MIIKLVMILFNTFLMLWVTSFIETGEIESEKEAKSIIQLISIVSVLSSIIFFKVIGTITDKYPSYCNIPCAFFLRVLAIGLFLTVNSPK
jgi:hypothetical protein